MPDEFDGYESYEDWHDNGPGSESFKRKLRRSEGEFYSKYEVVIKDGMIGFQKKKPVTDAALQTVDKLADGLQRACSPDDYSI